MAKLILFSGACNSGKTTTLLRAKAALTEKGYSVKVVSELIRDVISIKNETIDSIRSKPNKYFELQYQIIADKMVQEISAFADKSDTVYLFDRAMTDSLFYLENYVDKAQLLEANLIDYCSFHNRVHKYLLQNFRHYDLVIHFDSLDKNQLSIFRPKNLDLLKGYEDVGIWRLNWFYSECVSHQNLIEVDLNEQKTDEIIDKIIDLL